MLKLLSLLTRRTPFAPEPIKLSFAMAFATSKAKIIIRAKRVVADAEFLAKSYNTELPLELPDVKILRELLN